MPDQVPPKKPKNYSKILDMLNTPDMAKALTPKTYINLVGEYSKKALDNGEISKEKYMSIIRPLFGDVGIMASKKIEAYQKDLERYATGGRVNFKDGSNYWSMVTRKFIEAGGEKKTGMNINQFAAEYFPKMNND